MKMKKIILLLMVSILALTVFVGCDDTNTTDLSESESYLRIDECKVDGSMKDGILNMTVSYKVSNKKQEAVSEITLLTPNLKGSAMKDLKATVDGKEYELKVDEKDIIALAKPLNSGDSLEVVITYYQDELKMPSGSTEVWRITVPNIDKSALETGVTTMDVDIVTDKAITLGSSVPKGVEQISGTEMKGSLTATVNVLVLNVK